MKDEKSIAIKGILQLKTEENILGAVSNMNFEINFTKLDLNVNSKEFIRSLNKDILEHYSNDKKIGNRIEKVFIDINGLAELSKNM